MLVVEVVGVNTAIISPSGGSIGIGFSIPAEMATGVVAQLREGAVGILQASRQIAKSGNQAQIRRATEIVRDARKQLYQILGED